MAKLIIIIQIIIYSQLVALAQKMGPYNIVVDKEISKYYGLRDSLGTLVFKPGQYANLVIIENCNKKTYLSFTDTTTWLKGIIDIDKNIISPPVWSRIMPYSCGLSCVSISIKKEKHFSMTYFTDGCVGAINQNGQVVIPLIYGFIGQFYDSTAVFTTSHYADRKIATIKKPKPQIPYNGKFGLLDTRGVAITPEIYDFLDPFITPKNSTYFIARIKNKYGVINTKGRNVIQFEYKTIDEILPQLELL